MRNMVALVTVYDWKGGGRRGPISPSLDPPVQEITRGFCPTRFALVASTKLFDTGLG